MRNEIMKYELSLDSMGKELELERWKVSLLEDEIVRLHFELSRLHRRMNGLEPVEMLSPEESMELIESLLGEDGQA